MAAPRITPESPPRHKPVTNGGNLQSAGSARNLTGQIARRAPPAVSLWYAQGRWPDASTPSSSARRRALSAVAARTDRRSQPSPRFGPLLPGPTRPASSASTLGHVDYRAHMSGVKARSGNGQGRAWIMDPGQGV